MPIASTNYCIYKIIGYHPEDPIIIKVSYTMITKNDGTNRID